MALFKALLCWIEVGYPELGRHFLWPIRFSSEDGRMGIAGLPRRVVSYSHHTHHCCLFHPSHSHPCSHARCSPTSYPSPAARPHPPSRSPAICPHPQPLNHTSTLYVAEPWRGVVAVPARRQEILRTTRRCLRLTCLREGGGRWWSTVWWGADRPQD